MPWRVWCTKNDFLQTLDSRSGTGNSKSTPALHPRHTPASPATCPCWLGQLGLRGLKGPTHLVRHGTWLSQEEPHQQGAPPGPPPEPVTDRTLSGLSPPPTSQHPPPPACQAPQPKRPAPPALAEPTCSQQQVQQFQLARLPHLCHPAALSQLLLLQTQQGSCLPSQATITTAQRPGRGQEADLGSLTARGPAQSTSPTKPQFPLSRGQSTGDDT